MIAETAVIDTATETPTDCDNDGDPSATTRVTTKTAVVETVTETPTNSGNNANPSKKYLQLILPSESDGSDNVSKMSKYQCR